MKMSKPRDPPLVGFRAGWQPADNDDYGDGGGRLLPEPAPQPHPHPPRPRFNFHFVLPRLPCRPVSAADDCGCRGAQPSPRSPSTSSRRELATAARWCACCPAACAPGVPCGAAALTHMLRGVDTVDACVGLLGLRQDHDAQACAPEPRRKARRRGRPLSRVVLAARCCSWQRKKRGVAGPEVCDSAWAVAPGVLHVLVMRPSSSHARAQALGCKHIHTPSSTCTHSHNTLCFSHTHRAGSKRCSRGEHRRETAGAPADG